jgi:hypothetical protein
VQDINPFNAGIFLLAELRVFNRKVPQEVSFYE